MLGNQIFESPLCWLELPCNQILEHQILELPCNSAIRGSDARQCEDLKPFRPADSCQDAYSLSISGHAFPNFPFARSLRYA